MEKAFSLPSSKQPNTCLYPNQIQKLPAPLSFPCAFRSTLSKEIEVMQIIGLSEQTTERRIRLLGLNFEFCILAAAWFC
jgi:hypothetical protein